MARLAAGVEQSLIDTEGVRTGIGGSVLFVATGGLVAAGFPTSWFVAALGMLVALTSVWVRHAAAALLGVSGWALATGFGVNELGRLTFGVADLARLAGFVGLALLLGRGRWTAE